jgi:hypothetical protein
VDIWDPCTVARAAGTRARSWSSTTNQPAQMTTTMGVGDGIAIDEEEHR